MTTFVAIRTWTLAVAACVGIVGCSDSPIIIFDIPDAGAPCATGNNEPMCSMQECSKIGVCCAMDPNGHGCLSVCEPCCAIGADDVHGSQGYQCVPFAMP